MNIRHKISTNLKALVRSLLVPFSSWGGMGNSGAQPYWIHGGWDNGRGGAGAKYDYRTAAGNLWENSIVAACIDAISQAFSTAPPQLEKKEGDNWQCIDHPLIHLLNAPNHFYGSEHLWTATVGSECVNGNGFWRLRLNKAGTPAEIWWEPYAEPEYDRDNFIRNYILRVDGQGYRIPAAASESTFNDSDVIVHFRHSLHPQNPRWGWTPLSTALRHVAGDNTAASYHASLMRNSAVPSGFVSPPPATQGAPQTPVSPDQLKELLERLERKLTGEGAGRIAGMTLPLSYNRVGFSPDEMALDKLLGYYETRICAALRVPPMLLGLSSGDGTKTYSNYAECIEDFWRRTVIPLQERHGSEIESQVFPLFGLDREKYRLTWDRSEVPALQDDEAMLYDRLGKASGQPFLTVNEVRARLGKDPIEGGDELAGMAENETIEEIDVPSTNPATKSTHKSTFAALDLQRQHEGAQTKSFFLKVVDRNGMSHDELGLFDGGITNIKEASDRLKELGVNEVKIPDDLQLHFALEIIKSIRKIKPRGGATPDRIALIKLPNGVLAAAESQDYIGKPPIKALYLNSLFKNISEEELDRVLQANVTSNFLATPNYIDHELGHLTHFSGMSNDELKMVRSVKWNKDEDFGKEVAIAKKVSEYASQNPIEFVAEVYSGMISGKKYPQDVMDLYNKYAGPKVKDK